jgi:hypothetical protein
MPDASSDIPVRILAREFLGVSARIRMWCAIGIAFHGDSGDADDWRFGKALFQIVILRLAFRQTKPPAVIVDHDCDVIRVVERRRTSVERGIIEVPLRRSELPGQLGKIAAVFVVAVPAAIRGEIKLIPPPAAWLPIR